MGQLAELSATCDCGCMHVYSMHTCIQYAYRGLTGTAGCKQLPQQILRSSVAPALRQAIYTRPTHEKDYTQHPTYSDRSTVGRVNTCLSSNATVACTYMYSTCTAEGRYVGGAPPPKSWTFLLGCIESAMYLLYNINSFR